MKMDRILLVLVSLTIVMQAALLYQQHKRTSAAPSAADDPPLVRDAPSGLSIDSAGLPAKGDSRAKVVLVEFSDYECPFCARHAATVEPELQKRFVDTGKVRYLFANNPLSFHPEAKLLATSAICAGEQGRYWEMHDALFAERPKTKDSILIAAASAKLDRTRFTECLDAGHGADRLEQDSEEAGRLHLDGTPGFALGVADESGRVRIKKLIEGAQPFDVFNKAIAEVSAAGSSDD